jgi:hypothetical protein
VRVELAEHVTDGTRRFLVLGIGVQPQLAHGVDDTPLYRLQAVADMRQGTVHDHVHGVVEVGMFGEVSQRAAFYAVQAEIKGVAHAGLIGSLSGAAAWCRRAG